MTTQAVINVDRSTDFGSLVAVYYDTGEVVNVTNAQFICTAKKTFGVDEAFRFDVFAVDPTQGVLWLEMSANTTSSIDPGKYYFDMIMKTGSVRIKIASGIVNLKDTVSDDINE